MPGEKISELRKRYGMTQDELAAGLGVSTELVRAWESGLRQPGIEMILRLSEIFHVSTDYLLKEDTMPSLQRKRTDTRASDRFMYQEQTQEEIPCSDEEEEYREDEKDTFSSFRETVGKTFFDSKEENGTYILSKDEMTDYVKMRRKKGSITGAGVAECVGCVIPIVMLAGIQETFFPMFPNLPVLGVAVMFLLIAHAVTLFMRSSRLGQEFRHIEESPFVMEYEAEDLFRSFEKTEKEESDRRVTWGVALCVLSIIPVIVLSAVLGNFGTVFTTAGVSGMFAMIALAVNLFVTAGYQKGTLKILSQKGKYKPSVKKNAADFRSVYWLVMTAVYLGYSASTGNWHISWIIWVLAGIAYPIVMGAEKKE